MSFNMRSLAGRIWWAAFVNAYYQYETCLRREVGNECRSLLDVGCGFNSPVQCIVDRPRRLVGVDAFAAVIQQSRDRGIHDEYFLCGALEINTIIPPKSFEVVLASDLIEHLDKQDGHQLIAAMEKIARKKVIIYTPNGFLPQGQEYNNPMQEHRSGWTPGEMRSLGYRVAGIQGLKSLRGHMSEVRRRPARFWQTVSLASQSITTRWPRYAFRLFCVKEL
jgi:SAM-dependent methyltransferase